MKRPPSETQQNPSTDSDVTGPRLVGLLLVVTGVAHLLAPTILLQVASRSYRTVLNVEFDPLPGASRRVRAIGVGLVAAGAHLLYYDGIVPSGD